MWGVGTVDTLFLSFLLFSPRSQAQLLLLKEAGSQEVGVPSHQKAGWRGHTPGVPG